jgi:pimeloyl-ACP methyl ester carboxylesterase
MIRRIHAIGIGGKRSMTASPSTSNGPGRFASINGLRIYYEVHGAGDPIVVIPGGLMTIAMMRPLVDLLAQSRQVIGLEPQAHGHTADIDRPLTYEKMADDTAALIRHLGLGQADVLGFSVGAGVALQTAIRHPDVVRNLIVISGKFRGDGEFPEIRAFEATFAPDLPMLAPLRQAYLAAAPNPDGWASLVSKMRRLLAEDFDWSGDVAAIRTPMLIVVGDADTVPVAHALQLFTLLGGDTAAAAMGQRGNAQLAVLPGTTEFALLQRTELLQAIIPPFLAGSPSAAG